MKTLILYGSKEKLANSHKKVTGKHQPEYFVRADLSHEDISGALDHAKPMRGEVVLNTVEVPDSYTRIRP